MNVYDITKAINMNVTVVGNPMREFSKFSDIWEADEDSIVFFRNRKGREKAVKRTKARVIVCHRDTPEVEGKTLILTDRPKLFFVRALEAVTKIPRGIHPSVIIEDCVKIGKNVVIHPNCVIGQEGFGFVRNERGAYEQFPHIGGVIIEDDVFIGSGCIIDRGTLKDTIIGKGTKIGNISHIGHNVVIGENVIVGTNTSIHGSAKIEDGVWIAPGAVIRGGVTVGKETLVAIGAHVVGDVGEDTVVGGLPAKEDPKLKKPRWMPVQVPCVCGGKDPNCLICYGLGYRYQWIENERSTN